MTTFSKSLAFFERTIYQLFTGKACDVEVFVFFDVNLNIILNNNMLVGEVAEPILLVGIDL